MFTTHPLVRDIVIIVIFCICIGWLDDRPTKETDLRLRHTDVSLKPRYAPELSLVRGGDNERTPTPNQIPNWVLPK
jgi:hypothetical protein